MEKKLHNRVANERIVHCDFLFYHAIFFVADANN